MIKRLIKRVLIRFQVWVNGPLRVCSYPEDYWMVSFGADLRKLDIAAGALPDPTHVCLACGTPNWGFGDNLTGEYICIPCLIKMVKKVKELD